MGPGQSGEKQKISVPQENEANIDEPAFQVPAQEVQSTQALPSPQEIPQTPAREESSVSTQSESQTDQTNSQPISPVRIDETVVRDDSPVTDSYEAAALIEELNRLNA